jgi:pilus assembly protein CpaC
LQGAAPQKSKKRKCYSNGLTVRATQQVLLEVRFIEAQRSASRELGFGSRIKGSRIHASTGNGVLPALVSGLASSSVPFGNFVARVLNGGTSADVLIQALEKRGLVRRLAEPNLSAMSGDTANFLAGGEFPFPVAENDNRITVAFKKFGVGLAFTPTVLADGQINLKIEPEVSDIDPTQNLQFNNLSIPSLIVRRAKTTIELRDGQSFAIAGLFQSNDVRNRRQLPWIGKVPVLGALFSSAAFEKKESDLVIIVTPRLVRPAAPNQRLIAPTDRSLPSNDRDYFLRSREEVPRQWPAQYGHILSTHSGWNARVVATGDNRGAYK